MDRYKKITFIGGGWDDAVVGNHLGIKNRMYIDSEYWTHDGTHITCQKDFKARILFVQMCGNRTTSTVQARRSMYVLQPGDVYDDFLDTSYGGQLFATALKEFKSGDVVGCWEEIVTSAQSTVGIAVILEV